ncbi:YfhH family protein [Fictibacillus sp. Mic-4]|uniref:YfhH family protein n=1 Tax=Fictibacillus TaxID=1329200 RepID=UPI00040BCBB7|nr:YfhH family protein [Fictibacillus gelatini]
MEKRYSEMTNYELNIEISALQQKMQKAEQMGMVNEFAVYERKMAVAKSYLLDPKNFKPGQTYTIEGDPGSTFEILYMNGIFAWGYRNHSTELEAFPISLLKPE